MRSRRFSSILNILAISNANSYLSIVSGPVAMKIPSIFESMTLSIYSHKTFTSVGLLI